VFSSRFLPETKGQTLEQIERFLDPLDTRRQGLWGWFNRRG